MLPISEIFYSIQGEGCLAGVPSIFIRVFGCNLQCIWCDTPYASSHSNQNNQHQSYTIEQILEKIKEFPSQFVVITGGEPTLFPELAILTQQLKQLGKHITIETNGTQYNPKINVDLLSISPKLSNSTESHSPCYNLTAIHSWLNHVQYQTDRFQLKFAVQNKQDREEIQALLSQIPYSIPPNNILLMPIGTSVEQFHHITNWLIVECLKYGYRFCPRLHIYLFNGKRGY